MSNSRGDGYEELEVNEENEFDPSFLDVLDEEFEYSSLICDESTDNVDLYAVLGVDPNADEQEIRAAYRKLSRLLHPDKHHAGGDKPNNLTDDAQNAFNKVAAAYSILVDRDKRAIYDQYGIKGLNMGNWDIVLKDKSPAELRLEFMKLRALEKEQQEMNQIRPMSDFSLGIDATDLFDRYLMEDPQERYESPQFKIRELSMTQSASLFSTLRHNVNLVGHVTAHKGIGIGMLGLNWRYRCPKNSVLGPTILDSEISHGKAGHHLCTSFKMTRNISDRWSLFLESKLGFNRRARGLMLAPSLTVGTAFNLAPNIIARVEYTEFIGSKLSSSVEWFSENRKTTLKLKAYLKATGKFGIGIFTERVVTWALLQAPVGSGVSRNDDEEKPSEKPGWASSEDEEEKSNQYPDNRNGRVNVGIDLNTIDVLKVSLGARCPISKFSNLALYFNSSLTQGVDIRFTLFRGSQTYNIPINMSSEANIGAFGYGLVVPVATFAMIRYMIYEPWLRSQLKKAERFKRLKMRDELCKRRSEALAVQALMQASSLRSKDQASGVGGLVILSAWYGKINSDDPFSSFEEEDSGGALAIDVTIPLQCMILDNQLCLPPTKWCYLQGFYDPCVGLISQNSRTNGRFMRQLAVKYEFHHKIHVVTVDEGKGLAIPMSKHLQS